MKKSIIIILAILAVIVLWGISAYNGLVKLQEGVEKSWADVENQYQRRLDFIPNLVNTVKGYAAHEQQTFTQVVEVRAKATQLTLKVDDLTDENLQKYQQAQSELSSALSRLLAVSENYPELKANENFLQLQAQLEGTENRIAVERRNFNNAARVYNEKIRRFPTSLIVGIFKFDRKPYFQAAEEARRVPEVKF
ncbi:MAG: LemA family protein [Prevotellaceae bacterium]|jgi:LemA protein|nr:LemA family protein [Prevotellaceae bacterium]